VNNRSRNAARSAGARQVHKQQTYQALLHAALHLMEDQSFSSLSLREVTREVGIVPTAFYRHFRDMEQLGLALVDESFDSLREMLRSARIEPMPDKHVYRHSVEILARYVHTRRLHFRFIVRERYGGISVVRQAIRRELRLFVSELATDLIRFPDFSRWSTEDVRMVAALIVNAMFATAEAILDVPAERPEAETEIIQTAEKQLRLVLLAVPHWRSSTPPIGA
jgi:AcrR family transcriptional regulator